MTTEREAMAMSGVGVMLGAEGASRKLIEMARDLCIGQAPAGYEITVATQVLAQATAEAAAMSLFPFDAAEAKPGFEALCDGLKAHATAAINQLHRKVPQK